jgi:hypothetical protein
VLKKVIVKGSFIFIFDALDIANAQALEFIRHWPDQ